MRLRWFYQVREASEKQRTLGSGHAVATRPAGKHTGPGPRLLKAPAPPGAGCALAVSPNQRAQGRVARERPLLGEASSCPAAAPASPATASPATAPAPLSAEVAALCPGLRRALCVWQFQAGGSPGAQWTCFQPAVGRPSRGDDGGEGPRGAWRAKRQDVADLPAPRGRKQVGDISCVLPALTQGRPCHREKFVEHWLKLGAGLEEE